MSDWIENPLTGRYIKIGSKTHKLLVRTGSLSGPKQSNIQPKRTIQRMTTDDYNHRQNDRKTPSPIGDASYSQNQQNGYDGDDSDESEFDDFADDDSEYQSKTNSTNTVKQGKKLPKTLPNDIDIENMGDDELDELYELLNAYVK